MKRLLSADIIYIDAKKKDTNCIVAKYHNQCQVANKLFKFDRGVVVHGGSPVPTVNTTHGSVYDIAGKGKANPQPLNCGVTQALLFGLAA